MKKLFLLFLLVPAMLVQAATQITCAEARSYALSVSGNNVLYNDGEVFVVQGYVTSIATAWDSGWKNVSFWVADTENGGKVIEAFRCVAQTQADAPNVGALVRVTGQLTKFGSTPEFAQGCTCEILDNGEPPVNLGHKTIAEFIALANTKDTCILTGVVTNIVSSQYGNLYIEDATGSIYVYGIKNYSSYNIAVDDTLTIAGVYKYFNEHEVANAIYIKNSKYVEPTPGPGPQPEGVDFETAFANGWDQWIGQTVTFSNDFYFCESYYNSTLGSVYNFAPYRVKDAEEYGEEGTAAYNAAKAKITNDSCRIYYSNINYTQHRLGTRIRGVKAYIPKAHELQIQNSSEIQIIHNDFPTERPDLGEPDLVIVGANIENYYVTNVASGAGSEEALAVQTAKISSALASMNADIYALCEIEQGSAALLKLIEALGGTSEWGYTGSSLSPYNSTMAGFIYRKSKVQIYGSTQVPWSTYGNAFKYRCAVQGFQDITSGEKFYVSMNHFYAKITRTDADRETNMTDLISTLNSLSSNDPDILVLGDLNAYSGEEAVLKLKRDKNYVDLLMKYDPNGYSHAFGMTCGYLDHAYCSPSMENKVCSAAPYHLNSDTYKGGYNYASGNTSMYRYSDHDPILVGLKLGGSTPIENVTATEASAQKILRHGQIIIIRSGVEYTVTGQRVY